MQIPHELGRRELHPGTVIEVEEREITAELKTEAFRAKANQEVFVYHEKESELMKQAAVVDEHLAVETPPIVRFHTTGEAVSAENRQGCRVSTLTAELVARLGTEEGCPLLDVSATGFALIAKQRYEVGNHVPVTLYYKNESYSGIGCVQNIRKLSQERIRYGFRGVDDPEAAGDLLKGLTLIHSIAQREQLRRLAVLALN